MLLRSLVAVQVALSRRSRRSRPSRVPGPDPDAADVGREPDDRGQTTAEYALVLVGVAAIALLVVAWASDTNRIGRLLDGVLDSILDRIP